MKRVFLPSLILLITILPVAPAVSLEYIKISGTIKTNSLDPGPASLSAEFNFTPARGEVSGDGKYSIILPRNTPIFFYIATPRFHFKNKEPKVFNENTLLDFQLPLPLQFSGKVVDAQGKSIGAGDVFIDQGGLRDEYEGMSGLVDNLGSSLWGIKHSNSWSKVDELGNFNIPSYWSDRPRSLLITRNTSDSSTPKFLWRSAPFKGVIPKNFIACIPVNFGQELVLPKDCSEDENAWRDRTIKELAADKAAADLLAQQNAAAAKTAGTKKTSITCVKGKVTKKVSAINPKCPAGFKRR